MDREIRAPYIPPKEKLIGEKDLVKMEKEDGNICD